jgi:hypothetical protein
MAEYDPFLPPDDANPYAAPRSDLAPGLAGKSAEPMLGVVEPFSVGGVLSRAWRIFKSRMGITIGVVAGVYGILFFYQLGVGTVVQGVLSQAPVAAVILVQLVFVVFGWFLQLWLPIGLLMATLGVAREREIEFTEIFRGARFFWRFLGSSLLVGLVAFAVLALCAIPAVIAGVATWDPNNPTVTIIAAGIFGLIAFLAYLWVILRLSQYAYVLVDQDCGAIEAINQSYEMTRGHVVDLFLIYLVAGLVAISGVLACVVGLIFTYPLSMLVYACAYHLLLANRPGYGPKHFRSDLELLE